VLDQKFSHLPQCVLALGQQLVKVFGECRNRAIAIEDHRVVMVGHRTRQEDLDAEALRRLGEAVEKCVVGSTSGRNRYWRCLQRRVTM
jgi:hypothetical protein